MEKLKGSMAVLVKHKDYTMRNLADSRILQVPTQMLMSKKERSCEDLNFSGWVWHKNK